MPLLEVGDDLADAIRRHMAGRSKRRWHQDHFEGIPGEDPVPTACLAVEGSLLRQALEIIRDNERSLWEDARGAWPETRPQAEAVSMLARQLEGELWAELEDRRAASEGGE